MIAAMRGAVLVGVAARLIAAVTAQAVELVPPGKAGADQYFETVPNAGGNAAPPSGPPSSQALVSLGRGGTALGRLGTTGQSAAALAAATAPKPASGASGAASHGSSALSAIGKALGSTNSNGLGLVLPLVLATVLVLALAVVARRFIGRAGPPEVGA